VLNVFLLAVFFTHFTAFPLPNGLKGAGDVRYTTVVSLVSMFAVRVALGYYLGIVLGMGVLGIWLGMIADWAVRAVLFTIRFLRGKWMRDAVV